MVMFPPTDCSCYHIDVRMCVTNFSSFLRGSNIMTQRKRFKLPLTPLLPPLLQRTREQGLLQGEAEGKCGLDGAQPAPRDAGPVSTSAPLTVMGGVGWMGRSPHPGDAGPVSMFTSLTVTRCLTNMTQNLVLFLAPLKY